MTLARLRPSLLIVVALTLSTVGCDDVRFRPDARTAQPVFQPRTMRSLVSTSGLETLYRVEHPQGIALRYANEASEAFDLDLTLGPLERELSIDTWRVVPRDDVLSVRLETDSVSVVVPVRIAEGVGARICRYAVEADRVHVSGNARIAHNGESPRFESTEHPVVVLSNPQVNLIGDCPALEEAARDDSYAVDQFFIDYLTRAIAQSGREAIAIDPLASLGLVQGVVGLDRISSFDNRRGQLTVSGRVTQSNGSSLSSTGFDVDLDMAINSRRADCAPTRVPEAPATLSADEVPAAALESTGAHVGIAVAAPLVLRLAQSTTLAGFGCRGLESIALDGSGSNLAADDLDLDVVGLGELPIGPWVEPVIAPGELPEIEMDPVNGVIEVSWEQLSVELYAEIRGVPVRILQITADVVIAMSPVEHLDSIGFDVDAVLVTDATLQTQWSEGLPFESNPVRWTEVTLQAVLDDAIKLPIPLDPRAPLHLIDSQVRANDILLLFEFDRPF